MPTNNDLWNDAKNIPILLVASKLEIEVRSNKAMCFTNHDKKSPSLNFSPNKNLWHCFGCGLGGTTIDLVVHSLGMTPISAAKWLVNNFGQSSNHTSNIKLQITKTNYPPNEKFKIDNEAFKPDSHVYSHLMRISPLQKTGYDYLQNTRGFSSSIIDRFKICQITEPRIIIKELLSQWGEKRLLNCGLLKITDDKTTKFVWWDEVIIFPFFDNEENIIYLQARRLKGSTPKYVNLSNIKKPVYNFHILKKLILGNRVYICEGIPDTIAATQCGLNAIGILGANSFDVSLVPQLLDFEIFVIPDSDAAGRKMLKSIQNAFQRVGKPVEALIIPEGKDFSDVFVHLNRN
jgi:DNA primase